MPTIYAPGTTVFGCTSELMIDLTRAAVAAGVTIVAGTDIVADADDLFPALHLELEALVAAGLTPTEAIVASTRNAARATGIEDDYGTVEPGKVASFVVLGSDPTDDISALRDVSMVVKRGRIHRRKATLEP